MDKEVLTSIVERELKKAKIAKVNLLIRKDSEVYQQNELKKPSSYFVQISLDAMNEPPLPTQPHLDFWCDKKEINNIKINLQHLKGKGLGKRLVDAMENIGRALGYRRSVVNLFAENTDFWNRMGYERMNDYLVKHI